MIQLDSKLAPTPPQGQWDRLKEMPTYPKELNLGENVEKRLISYLDEILLAHDAERQGFLQDIMGWQRDYWAKPSNEINDYPFQGACNIVIPINAINVEAIMARVMTTHDALPELVAAKIKDPFLQQSERALEQFIDADLKNRVKYRDKIKDPILEIIKFGTGAGYSFYEKVTRTAIREIGGVEEEFEVTVREGAKIQGIPIARLLFPFNASSIEDAPWVGEEHTRTPFEVRIMEESGLFKSGTMDKLESYLLAYASPPSDGNQVRDFQADLENRTPVWPKELNWVEIWLAFDVNNDFSDEEIVVHYHRESQTLMSVRYNWNEDLHRKYRVGVYMPVEYRIFGVGVGKQVEQFMAEITTQHRQRIDNATIANTKMIAISKMSSYGPGEPIYPGKMWFLDDVSQIKEIGMGDVNPSSFSNEQMTTVLMQQRTGINDVTLGMPQAGTPGTATDTLARVKEGSTKFDYIYANIKHFLDELVMDYVCDSAQFGARNIDIYPSDDNELVRKILSLPPSQLRTGLTLELKTSGQKDNKLQDRQDWIQLSPQVVQYFTSLLQLAQVSGIPNLEQQIALHGMNAASEVMKQILQTFDVRNLDRILFDVSKLNPGGANGFNQSGNPQLGLPQPGGIAGLIGGFRQ